MKERLRREAPVPMLGEHIPAFDREDDLGMVR